MNKKDKDQLRQKSVLALKQLSVEQQNIARSKTINQSHSASEWLVLLEDLARFDEYSDEYAAKSGSSTELLWSFTFFYYIIFAVVWFAQLLPIPIWAYILLATIPALPWILYNRDPTAKFGRLDLPNYFRQFVLPLLFYLREESNPEEKISLKMDMSPIHKQMEKTTNPLLQHKERKANYTQVGQKFFDCPLMEIHTQLADNTQLDFVLELSIRQRERYRSKGNKSKFKIQAFWNLVLTFPKKNYVITQNPPQSSKEVQLKYIDKPKKHIFRLKTSTPIYTTTYATKGNQYMEYNKFSNQIMNAKILEFSLFLKMMGTAYRQVKRI